MKLKWLGNILIAIVLIVLFGMGVMLMSRFNQPLSPGLSLNGPAASAKGADSSGQQHITPAGQAKFCGETGAMNLLIIGNDSDIDNPHSAGLGLIRAARVNFEAKSVAIFTFPYQLWVQTNSLADLKINASTIGKVFDFRYDATRMDNSNQADNPQDRKKLLAATNTIAQTLVDDFDLVSDHYLTVNLDRLPAMIDILGGITFNNPARLVTNNYAYEAGQLTLDGVHTKDYIRYIGSRSSDWNRISRQNLVLDAIRARLLDPSIIIKIPELFKELRDSFITDLTPAQIVNLTCMLNQVFAGEIVKGGITQDMVSELPGGGLIYDESEVALLLQKMGFIN